MRVTSIILSLALIVIPPACALGDAWKAPAYLPTPAYPDAALKDNEQGTVVVRVSFGVNGKVSECIIINSDAPPLLQKWTVDFISIHWTALKKDAGKEFTFPVVYDSGTPAYKKRIAPPNFLRKGDPECMLRLRISFDQDGFISEVQVIQSTGIFSVDEKTVEWVKQHWRSGRDKSKTIEVPIFFPGVPA